MNRLALSKERTHRNRLARFIGELQIKARNGESLSASEMHYTAILELIINDTHTALSRLHDDTQWSFVLGVVLRTAKQCQQTIHDGSDFHHIQRIEFLLIIFNRCMGQRNWWDWLVGGYEKKIVTVAQGRPLSCHPQKHVIMMSLSRIVDVQQFLENV